MRFCYSFFPFTAMCRTRNYLFVSSKNQSSYASFQQSVTWNLFNYSGCFLEIFPSFPENRSYFREVFLKWDAQQNYMTKVHQCTSDQKQKQVICKFIRIALYHRFFRWIWQQVENSDIGTYISVTVSDAIIFGENSWSKRQKAATKIYSF